MILIKKQAHQHGFTRFHKVSHIFWRLERSDLEEKTASRQLSKVKLQTAWLVPLWGTKWESRVMFYFLVSFLILKWIRKLFSLIDYF